MCVYVYMFIVHPIVIILHTVEPLYNGHLWGTKFWPLYRGGLCRGVVLCTDSSFGTPVPGRYIAVDLSSGVAVKRGSTVLSLL